LDEEKSKHTGLAQQLIMLSQFAHPAGLLRLVTGRSKPSKPTREEKSVIYMTLTAAAAADLCF
jgi:hypothetical protein